MFSGWSGACVGTSLNCTIVVDSEAPVTATFLTPYKLVLKTSGTGTVSSNPGDTTFLQGTVVTLTATPAAGAPFTCWTGGCTGTSLTCTFTVNAHTTVTATFRGTVAPPPTATYRLVNEDQWQRRSQQQSSGQQLHQRLFGDSDGGSGGERHLERMDRRYLLRPVVELPLHHHRRYNCDS
ncbi:MAG: hypothetical protein QOJ99_5903 [Bryobacterales bacterium]|nr:hypothetical protein [Bryobacterales bacterium]